MSARSRSPDWDCARQCMCQRVPVRRARAPTCILLTFESPTKCASGDRCEAGRYPYERTYHMLPIRDSKMNIIRCDPRRLAIWGGVGPGRCQGWAREMLPPTHTSPQKPCAPHKPPSSKVPAFSQQPSREGALGLVEPRTQPPAPPASVRDVSEAPSSYRPPRRPRPLGLSSSAGGATTAAFTSSALPSAGVPLSLLPPASAFFAW